MTSTAPVRDQPAGATFVPTAAPSNPSQMRYLPGAHSDGPPMPAGPPPATPPAPPVPDHPTLPPPAVPPPECPLLPLPAPPPLPPSWPSVTSDRAHAVAAMPHRIAAAARRRSATPPRATPPLNSSPTVAPHVVSALSMLPAYFE